MNSIQNILSMENDSLLFSLQVVVQAVMKLKCNNSDTVPAKSYSKEPLINSNAKMRPSWSDHQPCFAMEGNGTIQLLHVLVSIPMQGVKINHFLAKTH